MVWLGPGWVATQPGPGRAGPSKPLVTSTAVKPGPPALGARPEQMTGSKSRMQGKIEQSAKSKLYVGIDVSKAWLDIALVA